MHVQVDEYVALRLKSLGFSNEVCKISRAMDEAEVIDGKLRLVNDET